MRRPHVGPAALALLLCVLISSLSVLAYASPPDPSWARGVYDGADFDDVVCLIIANAGSYTMPPPWRDAPTSA